MPRPKPKELKPDEILPAALRVLSSAKFPMMATVDGDQPRVRPVSPLLTRGFETYIGNLKSYHKTVELAQNPRVELCYFSPDHDQVRITATVEVVTDQKTLKELWRKNPLLKHYLGTPDNPELIVYHCIPNRVRYMQEWALTYYEIPLDFID